MFPRLPKIVTLDFYISNSLSLARSLGFMKFVFLGTTGYHPNNRRHTASIMFPELGLILDAGTGIFRARNYLETDTIHLFLSHAHLDHSLGLTFLFDIGFQKELKTTRVYGDEQKLESVERFLSDPLIFPARLPMQMNPIPSNRLDGATFDLPGGARLSTISMKHPGGSLGFLIEQGEKRVAYITDTTASVDEPYVEFIRDVDVLIHECYFPDGYEEQAELTGHSCATPVAEVALKANVGKLYCVHVNPLDESDDPIGIEKIQEIFPNATIPDDLDEVTL